MTLLALSKAGFGSYVELKKLSATVILDMVEFCNIQSDIEHYQIEQARGV